MDGSITEVNESASLAIMNGIFSGCDRLTRGGYQSLLYILEWMPALLTGVFSFGRFSRLSPQKRHAHLDAMRTSKFYLRRALFKAMLAPIWICHYARAENQLLLGFDSEALTTHYQKAKTHA